MMVHYLNLDVGQTLHVNKITPFPWKLNTQICTVLIHKYVCHCRPNKYVKTRLEHMRFSHFFSAL